MQPRLTIGICPSINPRATVEAIDNGSAMFRWYFMRKWRATVNAKAAAWPEYAAAAESYLRMQRLIDITACYAEEQTEYGALEPYLAAYTLAPEQIVGAASPLAIITAADDPVISPGDFRGLDVRGALQAFAGRSKPAANTAYQTGDYRLWLWRLTVGRRPGWRWRQSQRRG